MYILYVVKLLTPNSHYAEKHYFMQAERQNEKKYYLWNWTKQHNYNRGRKVMKFQSPSHLIRGKCYCAAMLLLLRSGRFMLALNVLRCALYRPCWKETAIVMCVVQFQFHYLIRWKAFLSKQRIVTTSPKHGGQKTDCIFRIIIFNSRELK